jgi:hypothetical protein
MDLFRNLFIRKSGLTPSNLRFALCPAEVHLKMKKNIPKRQSRKKIVMIYTHRGRAPAAIRGGFLREDFLAVNRDKFPEPGEE